MKFFSLVLSAVLTTNLMALKIGDKAPDFTLKGEDGKEYKLSDQKGKIVALEWFNDGCPYVQKFYEAKKMQELQQKYTKQGVVWFSVISSAPTKQGHLTPSAAKDLKTKWDTKQTAFLLDTKGTVGKAYQAKTTPHMYLINKDGKLAYQGAIDDKPSTNPKSLTDATPLFANALDSTLANKPIAVETSTPYGCSVKY